MKSKIRTLAILIPLLVLASTLPLFSSVYFLGLIVTVLMYIILTVSWNFFSGYTGYISLATAAFFGIGCYVAVMGWPVGIPYPVLVIIGGLASMVFAVLVGFPALRIRGPYFIILTLGLSELTRYIFLSYEVNVRGFVGAHLVGGPSMETFYYCLLIIAIVVIVTDHLIRNSKFGFGLLGIGGDEEAAEAMGVDTTRYKLSAFALSALFAGCVGVIMALRWTYIETGIAFDLRITFQVIIMAILGGTKDFRGPILGAVVLTAIAETLGTKYPYHYMVMLGVVLILLIMFMPTGLLGAIERLQIGRKYAWLKQVFG